METTAQAVERHKKRLAQEQLEFEQSHPVVVEEPTVSAKYWRLTNYDPTNVTHQWFKRTSNGLRIFKTDAGLVVACCVSIASEKRIDEYWFKNNGNLPVNIIEQGNAPAADFVVYVATEEEAAKSRLLAVIETTKQDLLSGKVHAAQQIKTIVDSVQQIKKPNPFEPKAGDLVVKKMGAYKQKKQCWLWQDRVPIGTLTTIAGEPDQGKSLVTLDIAARLTTGKPFYGETETHEAADVLMLCAEDDPETTLAPRLAAVGADLDRVTLIESVILQAGVGDTFVDRVAQLDQDLAKIEQVLEQNKDIKLIIVDPISSFLGNASMVKEQEVRRVLQPLVKICLKRRLAVILVAHFNKNSDTRSAIDRVGGAKAIVGLGRASWTCVREPKMEDNGKNEGVELADPERRLFLKLKGNLTPTSVGGLVYTIRTSRVQVEGDNGPEMVEIPHIVWLEKTESTAQDVVIDQNHKPTMQADKTKGARQWLKDYLRQSGGAAWSADIFRDASEYGYSVRMLQRALGSLTNYRSVRSGSGHTQWLEPGAKELTPNAIDLRPDRRRKRANTVSLEPELPVSHPELAGQHAK